MAYFLLLHGSLHNQTCWFKVERLLKGAGHKVASITFSGQQGGRSKSPFLVTANDYAQDVLSIAATVGEPIVAVAHSMGGFPMSMAAEKHPELFKHLVFVSALVPPLGSCSIFSVGRGDRLSNFSTSLSLSLVNASLKINQDIARELFYHDCAVQDQERALRNLLYQPIRPLLSRAKFSVDGLGAVPKTYIVCTQDKACSPEFQRQLASNQNIKNIEELHCSHSPFLSQPSALVSLLERVLAD